MSRPFLFGLVSAALGLVMGVIARLAGAGAHGFVAVFAFVTLVGCLTGAVVVGKQVHDTEDGYVGLGDAFFAVGTLVVLVESLVFTLTGSLVAFGCGALVLAATLWALRQERRVSLAASGVMALLALVWAMAGGMFLGGSSPAVLWAFAAASYVASLATGEQVGEPTSEPVSA